MLATVRGCEPRFAVAEVMVMLRLNIEQTHAKLELDIKHPFLEIQTTPPKIQLDTQAAVVEIRQGQGTLEIDQYPSRASYGYKNMDDRTREIVQEAQRIALEVVGRITEEGNRMGRIESGENAIAAIAEERYNEPPLDVTLSPIAAPIIRYTPKPVEYNVIPAKLDLTLQRGTVDLHLQRGTVTGRLNPYNSIRMWTTGSRIDMSA